MNQLLAPQQKLILIKIMANALKQMIVLQILLILENIIYQIVFLIMDLDPVNYANNV